MLINTVQIQGVHHIELVKRHFNQGGIGAGFYTLEIRCFATENNDKKELPASLTLFSPTPLEIPDPTHFEIP